MRYLIALAALAATDCAGTQAGLPTAYDLRGTEPFWGLSVRDERLVLSRPDHPPLVASAKQEPGPGGQRIWRARELTAVVSPGACSDGMSDIRYPMGAEVKVSGEAILKGCAQPAAN